MSVYLRGGVWWMDFWYRGQRVRKSTEQLDREAAEAVERKAKDALRQVALGVAAPTKLVTPRIQEWAEIYLDAAEKKGKIRRIDRLEDLTRVALGFWGATPTDPLKIYPDAPYHDLRLEDPITDPTWLHKWETWLADAKRPRPDRRGHVGPARRWSGQTRNQYRSLMSQMYELALRSTWRPTSGITTNPFLSAADRDRPGRRVVALEIDDLRAIIQHASPHLRVAMSVALLAPKMRLGSILALRFDTHLTPDLQWLTVGTHKTVGDTLRPMVAYVPEQLRQILAAARATTSPKHQRLVHYHGQPVSELRGAVRGAIERAAEERPALRYGRFAERGITFHTLRHSAGTNLAALGVPPDLRQGVMGHSDMASTLLYTHLRPVHEIAPAELASQALPIADLILAPVGTSVPNASSGPRKLAEKPRYRSKRNRIVGPPAAHAERTALSVGTRSPSTATGSPIRRG